MISINQKKLINSLTHKKHREKHGLFLLEGDKTVRNALEQNSKNLVRIKQVWASEEWRESIPENSEIQEEIINTATSAELKSVSSMITSPGVIAIAQLPSFEFSTTILQDEITLVLDSIRDPGNLGTIIRTADWFGFKNIICSSDCVDAYNTKVVQASMGAILRVKVYYQSLSELIISARKMKVKSFGTTMDGGSIYDACIKRPAMVIFGNESGGISSEIINMLDEKILIPGVAQDSQGTESLNVGSSLAIVCAEIRRRGV